MKIKFIIASFLLLLSGIVNAKISDTEAKKLVEDYVANKEGLENAVVYQAPDLLTKISISLGDSIVMEHPSWCFFIDPTPNAGWEHKCKYAIISSLNGDMRIISKMMYPKSIGQWNNLKEKALSKLRARDYNTGMLKYHLYDSKYVKGKNTKPRYNTYALIISGGQNVNGRKENFWNTASLYYQTLVDYYKVPKDHIRVLMSNGIKEENNYGKIPDTYSYNGNYSITRNLDGVGDDDVDGACTVDNIQKELTKFSNKLSTKDTLMLFLDTHGSIDYVALWDDLGPRLSKTQLKNMLNGLSVGHMLICITSCYGGSFIDAIKGPNRTILTATSSYEIGWMTGISNFAAYMAGALTGVYSNGNLEGSDENREWNNLPINADYNGDGKISLEEAFTYDVCNDAVNGYNTKGHLSTPHLWTSKKWTQKLEIKNGCTRIMSGDNLEASNIISNAEVTYHSDKKIYLKKGFKVAKGSKFKGIVKGNCLRSLDIPVDLEEDEFFEYEGITNIDDAISEIEGVEIYPNPTDGLLYIHADSKINKIVLTDMAGKVIMEDNGGSDEIEIDLSSNAKGVYVVNVITENESYVNKVVLK